MHSGSDRPTLVTGATGLVGGWLVRDWWTRGADVVCLVRDWVPQSELVRARDARAGESRPRRCARPGPAGARSRRIRDRHGVSIWPRRPSSASPTAIRFPPSKRNIQGTWTCWKPAGDRPAVKADRGRLLRQGLRRSGRRCRIRKRRRSQGAHPYDVSKSCADLIAQAYARYLRSAGGDHPLREFLRRRRSELEPHRAGHHSLGAARRAARDPLRRPVRPRLLLRGGRRRGLHAAGRATGGRSGLCAGRPSTSPTRFR